MPTIAVSEHTFPHHRNPICPCTCHSPRPVYNRDQSGLVPYNLATYPASASTPYATLPHPLPSAVHANTKCDWERHARTCSLQMMSSTLTCKQQHLKCKSAPAGETWRPDEPSNYGMNQSITGALTKVQRDADCFAVHILCVLLYSLFLTYPSLLYQHDWCGTTLTRIQNHGL